MVSLKIAAAVLVIRPRAEDYRCTGTKVVLKSVSVYVPFRDSKLQMPRGLTRKTKLRTIGRLPRLV